MAKSKKKYYVVWEGNETGVFDNWPDCQKQVKGYFGARYKSFKSKELAEEAYYGNSSDYIGKNVKKDTSLTPEQLKKIGQPILESLAVDAACSGNPGVLEYQGVDTKSGIRFFHQGPFPHGTVNLGEFLALVHGLAYLKQKGSTIPVYSDSRTAMAWVRDKRVRTTLKPNNTNRQLFALVERGLTWLKNNTYSNKVLKWETAAWGEIPADFGRK
ncbi:MAG: viroplasmin family protein [Chitinophagales bacterium]